MLKIYLILISLFLFCETKAQNIDSTAKAESGFFNKWRVAGVNFSGGILYPKTPLDISFFNSVLVSNRAKDKYSFDVAEVNKYNGHLSNRIYEEIAYASLKVVFKPKKIKFNKLLSYLEIATGLTYSDFSTWSSFDDFILIDSNYKEFSTSYNFENRNIALDGLFTLQSPGILSRFSIYSGIGLVAGASFDSWVTSNPSKQEVGIDNFDYRDDTVTYFFGKENGYAKTNWLLGWYIPIGLKANISARSNLFIEYTISNRTLFFDNKFKYSTYITGYSIGFRYKFANKYNSENDDAAPATKPEPFY